MDSDLIDHLFAFHAATTQEKKDEHTSVRQRCAQLAHWINEATPDGDEKNMAILRLQEVMFWGNAGIARST